MPIVRGVEDGPCTGPAIFLVPLISGPGVYESADLDYFRHLLGGEDAIAWHWWWPGNEARLRSRLPRTEYLKLKFDELKHAASVLEQERIPFTWSPRARTAARFADLDPKILDSTGAPLESYWHRVFGALVSAFESGQDARGRQLARRRLQRILKEEPIAREEELEEWQDGAELLYHAGLRRAALGLLRVLAELEDDDDLLAPAIHHARRFLREHEDAI